MSFSVVTCFHNRPVNLFRNCLKTLQWQTVQPTEIILSDYSNPQNPEIKQLCKDYNIKYVFHNLKQPATTLALNYFTWAINAGIRQATGNRILTTGTDYLFKEDVFSLILEAYENHPKTLILAPAYDLKFVPTKISKESFNSYWRRAERKSRGQAITCTDKEWLFKIRGYDQRLWRGEDEDLIRRAMLDQKKTIRLNPEECLIFHQPHRHSRKQYADWRNEKDKVFFKIYKEQTVIRNDENWGLMK